MDRRQVLEGDLVKGRTVILVAEALVARTFYNLNRWICIRTDELGGLFASGLAAYLVYGRAQSASKTGFSLNMAVAFSINIFWWIRCLNSRLKAIGARALLASVVSILTDEFSALNAFKDVRR
ncbi:hypothetical protein V5O48_012313 [Marasmius crinis-equi]|uniref:Uncharacterized protein n=1 Tax=Marasmius crinis-equi TaxID=585013 RepID=A0ABR3F374_9AGAR